MIELNIAHRNYDEAMEFLVAAFDNLTTIECSIEFWADHSQSKIIRDFIGKIFDAHGIRSLWRGRFILITDELINNAIEHGSAKDDLDTCVIHAGKSTDWLFQISLEVHDTGNWKDSWDIRNMAQVMNTHTRHKWVYMGKRGRWLFHITEKLVDTLTFSESPKWWLAVKIEKTIPEKFLTEKVA